MDVSNMSQLDKDDLMNRLNQLQDFAENEKWDKVAEECFASLNLSHYKKGKSNHKVAKVPQDLIGPFVELLAVAWIQLNLYQKLEDHSAAMDYLSSKHDQSSGSKSASVAWQDLYLYAKYRLDEYAAVVSKSSSKQQQKQEASPLQRHVLAQSLFRIHNTKKALQCYQDMWNDTDDQSPEDQVEILVNALTIASSNGVPMINEEESKSADNDDDHANWVAQAADAMVHSNVGTEPDDEVAAIYHDFLYNYGTHSSLSGDHGKGMHLLKQAERTCQANEGDDGDITSIAANQTWARHWKGFEVGATDYPMVRSTKQKPASLSEANQAIIKLNQALAMGLPQLPHIPAEQQQSNYKWTPLQSRLYWYNRAVVQLKAQKYDECNQSCQSLKSTVSTKSSSKKNAAAATGNYVPCLSPQDAAWWLSRVDVLNAHCMVGKDPQQRTAATDLLQKRLDALQELSNSPSFALDQSIAHIQLHMFHLQNTNDSKQRQQKAVQLLESLPPSIQSKKAVLATLRSLKMKTASANAAKAESSAFLADVLFSQGKFEQAASMYQKHLPKVSSSCTDEELQQLGRHVQALARSGQPATELWESLKPIIEAKQQQQSLEDDDDNDDDDDSVDAEALENKELPRIHDDATKELLDVNTNTAADGTKSKQKSKESIQRRRARKREKYLAALEAKGQYDPNRPTKPNPDRWLPKYARSSYRGGRRNNNAGHRGAQGGGNERDALKLDVAARKAGGAAYDVGGPSTASMKVSSGGARRNKRR